MEYKFGIVSNNMTIPMTLKDISLQNCKASKTELELTVRSSAHIQCIPNCITQRNSFQISTYAHAQEDEEKSSRVAIHIDHKNKYGKTDDVKCIRDELRSLCTCTVFSELCDPIVVNMEPRVICMTLCTALPTTGNTSAYRR